MLKWNRRQFLSGLLTAASAGAAGSAQALSLHNHAVTPQATSAPSVASPATSPTPGPTALLDDGITHGLQDLLPEGLRFGRWRVVSVLPVKLGAVPVVLESRQGERFQVDVLRRDRSARARRGLSETRGYSLFLFNRGQGDTPTQEDHGLAVLWLAALLRPREHTRPDVALLTQRERTQRFPRGKFNALVIGTSPTYEPIEPSLAQTPQGLPVRPNGAGASDAEVSPLASLRPDQPA
jgi:hypothetical protein